MSLRATLFDMDGLLLDSEVLWHKAEVEIFGALGVPLKEAEGRSTKGMYVNEVVEYWRSRYPWEGPSTDEVVDMLLARVGELVEIEGRLLPGASRALDLTGERGPLALASSTPMVCAAAHPRGAFDSRSPRSSAARASNTSETGVSGATLQRP